LEQGSHKRIVSLIVLQGDLVIRQNLGGNEYVVLIAPSYTMALSTASRVEDEISEVKNSVS
jgi:hypothetical protein